MERTEEQKLLRQPVVVMLGERTFELRPLPLGRASTWLRRYSELIGGIASVAGLNETNIADSAAAIQGALGGTIDDWLELLLLWAPELDREYIIANAYPEELGAAIEICYAMANPIRAARLNPVTGR